MPGDFGCGGEPVAAPTESDAGYEDGGGHTDQIDRQGPGIEFGEPRLHPAEHQRKHPDDHDGVPDPDVEDLKICLESRGHHAGLEDGIVERAESADERGQGSPLHTEHRAGQQG